MTENPEVIILHETVGSGMEQGHRDLPVRGCSDWHGRRARQRPYAVDWIRFGLLRWRLPRLGPGQADIPAGCRRLLGRSLRCRGAQSMTWHFPWQSRAEADRDTWAARYAELQRHVEGVTASLDEAHRTIEAERGMGALAERVAEGYRAHRDEAFDDITRLVDRDQEAIQLLMNQRRQIVALTAERDDALKLRDLEASYRRVAFELTALAQGERDAAIAERDGLRKRLERFERFHGAKGRFVARQAQADAQGSAS